MMEFFQRSSGTRRFFIFAVAAVVVVGIWGVSKWASAPMYLALYQNLDFKEASDIDASLQSAGIPHKLGAGGTEVLVPAFEVARARVALAKDGHSVSGRPGLELFDKPAWGMTDFAQRVTFQRALEGELARTVAGLKGIERAQVHLALPSPSPLRRMERQASASVVLTLSGAGALSPETIQGITFVVSNSVELLSANNVAVMDDAGRLLSMPSSEDEGGGASSRQVEIQRATEDALVAKIENLLEPVLGRGKVRAEVSAELDFDKVARTVETIGAMAADASGESAAGATGGAPAGSPDAGNSRELKRSESSVGKLIRLTATVVVDQAVVGEAAAGEGDEAAAGTSVLRVEQVEAMVRNAIGVEDARGDRLTVMAVPFEAAAGTEIEPGTGSDGSGLNILSLAEQWVRPLVGLAAIVVLVIFALKALRLQASRPVVAPPAVVEGPEASPQAYAAAGGGAAGPGGQHRPEVDLQVVRNWLKDS